MCIQSQAICHGTFGELIQGSIDSKAFLVTLPIHKFSCVKYIEGSTKDNREHFSKSYKAAEILRKKLGKEGDFYLEIQSELLRGKGLASSSADIVATLKAILHGENMSEASEWDLISSICRQVEPTDGVMIPGYTAYFHHECQMKEQLGFFPFEIIGIMEDGEVDTLQFNSKNIRYTSDEIRIFKELYEQVKHAVKRRDTKLIGKSATISATISQNYLPKKNFHKILELVNACNASGVCVAHSGTAIGIILEINDSDYYNRKEYITSYLKSENISFEIYRTSYSKTMSYDI